MFKVGDSIAFRGNEFGGFVVKNNNTGQTIVRIVISIHSNFVGYKTYRNQSSLVMRRMILTEKTIYEKQR